MDLAEHRCQNHKESFIFAEDSFLMLETTSIYEMLKIATDFYKNLFHKEHRPDIRLRQDFFKEEEKVSMEEKRILEASFTLEEIRVAVFGSYSDGAPGPNGLPFSFIRNIGI